MRPRKLFFIPFFILAAVAALSFVVMQLWNHILVPVLEINPISYWQAAGILILSKILFGFGTFGGRHGGFKSKMGRWRNMSMEEKSQFKERWKHNWKAKKEENEKK